MMALVFNFIIFSGYDVLLGCDRCPSLSAHWRSRMVQSGPPLEMLQLSSTPVTKILTWKSCLIHLTKSTCSIHLMVILCSTWYIVCNIYRFIHLHTHQWQKIKGVPGCWIRFLTNLHVKLHGTNRSAATVFRIQIQFWVTATSKCL